MKKKKLPKIKDALKMTSPTLDELNADRLWKVYPAAVAAAYEAYDAAFAAARRSSK